MAMNRVQFQRGLSMSEFERLYGTQEQCEEAVLAWRWPNGFACPRCAAGSRTQFRRGTLLYLQCGTCQYQCSLIAGTIFASTKLALKTWFQAMHLLTKTKTSISALELSRDLDVGYRCAWLLKHKLMETMRLREQSRQLTGRVEIDDAYLGGERAGGKPGRGSENKVAFVAAVQTNEAGQALRVCLSLRPFTNESMKEFAATALAAPLTVVSDGLPCFAVAAATRGGEHDRTVTGGGKAAVKLPQFKAVNTVLGNLKTALSGTYKAFDFQKYGHRYLAEFQYRFNRRFHLAAMLRRLAIVALHCQPLPEYTIRAAEVAT
jgi:ISXO2-like transposase domain/Transposase zinc-ribbon domain